LQQSGLVLGQIRPWQQDSVVEWMQAGPSGRLQQTVPGLQKTTSQLTEI
jgi:hypothetical protein